LAQGAIQLTHVHNFLVVSPHNYPMSQTKFVAVVSLLASAVVQANQCSCDGGCPSNGELQNGVSLLQTELQRNVIEDSTQRLSRMVGLGTNPSNTDTVMSQLQDALKKAGQEVTEGHTEDEGPLKIQTDQYDQWATDVAIKTICETGFNAGHSAARFLSDGNAKVYEFDFGSHAYAHTAEAFLTAKFPDRLKVTWGDSMKTLPQFHIENPDIKCDLVSVDGGHSFEVADADLRNFAQMASSKHFLVIDDTPCETWSCEGPMQAWKNLVQQGCIKELRQVNMGTNRGFTTGQYTPCPSLWPNFGK